MIVKGNVHPSKVQNFLADLNGAGPSSRSFSNGTEPKESQKPSEQPKVEIIDERVACNRATLHNSTPGISNANLKRRETLAAESGTGHGVHGNRYNLTN